MDFRFIVVLLVIMAILDLLGRLARKRAGVVPGEEGDSLEGADVLKALTGEQPKAPPGLPERTGRPEGSAAHAVRDQAVPAVLPRTRPVAPPAGELPAAQQAVPIREVRVLELRDRAPREIEVRSREPRPMEPRSSPPVLRPPEETAVGAGSSKTKPRRHPPPPARRSRSTDVGKRLGLGSADNLRRVVVAREVLGRPLAMRDE